MDLLEFARGPALQTAAYILVAGMLWRISGIVLLKDKTDYSEPRARGGIGAALLQVAAEPMSTVPMVGASGAIGGVMGAYVLLYPRVHVHLLIFLGFFVTTIAVPAVFMLGYWFLVQLISGVGTLSNAGGGVAFWAHVGGFVAGATLIPIDHDEVPFELGPLVELRPGGHGEAGAA
ncbi:MAG: rhomboid family intramembrane serine protease, partial [Xanthomonadales bacterium]